MTTTDPLTQLAADHHAQAELAGRRWQRIAAALCAGHTWDDIAQALDDTELGALLTYLDDTATLPQHQRNDALQAAGITGADDA